MTYFVKCYGYHENGDIDNKSFLLDVESPITAENFMKRVEEVANFSPYRHKKEIIIDSIVKL